MKNLKKYYTTNKHMKRYSTEIWGNEIIPNQICSNIPKCSKIPIIDKNVENHKLSNLTYEAVN